MMNEPQSRGAASSVADDARAATPRRAQGLSIVVFDGHVERVHYALVMASAAAAIDRPVRLLFAGAAIVTLLPDGWQQLGGDPAAVMERLRSRGIAELPALIEACHALGVRFMACELAVRAAGLEHAAADGTLGADCVGFATFLAGAPADGALIFV